MGNDPINNTDPSGGFVVPPVVLSIPGRIVSIVTVVPEVVTVDSVSLSTISATTLPLATILRVGIASSLMFGAMNIHSPGIVTPVSIVLDGDGNNYRRIGGTKNNGSGEGSDWMKNEDPNCGGVDLDGFDKLNEKQLFENLSILLMSFVQA